MRTVRDSEGTRYVVLKKSSESSLIRDPHTGERRQVPNADLEPVTGESPLDTSARAVHEPVRQVVTAVRDERALGLLLELDVRGTVSVRALLDETELCESDLHGMVAEFRAAGLVAETRVGGERGYETTEAAEVGLATLREDTGE